MDDKERKRPRVIPQPDKVPIVDPIIAADTLHTQAQEGIPSDVDGSYTGTPVGGGKPEQDADDL